MKQQIEFIKALPNATIQLPSQWILMAIIATIGGGIIISMSMLFYQVHQYISLKTMLTQNERVMAESERLSRQYPLLSVTTALINNLPIMENTLKAKQAYYASLSRIALRQGFSEYLSTLATLIPEELWLKKIMINQESNTFLLEGYMTDPVKISVLTQAMQNAAVFSRVNFNLLDIKEVPKETYTEFTVSNKPQSTTKAPHDNR